LQRAAPSQHRSQRPPSLSPTQWTGSYGSPSPPIGSDIEAEYPAARPTVYQPWSTGIDNAPMQVVADSRQPGSTVDPRIYVPEMSTFVSLAAEVQPHVAHSEAGHVLSKGIDVARPTPAHVAPTHDTPTHMSTSAGLMSAAHAVCPSSMGAHVMSRPTLADDESVYIGVHRSVRRGVYRFTSADVCRNVDCTVTIVVGPLPYVAAFVTVECAGVATGHRYSCTSG